MTTRTRKRLLMAAGTVLAVAALVFHYKQRDSYRCQICFAKKDVFQWRLGSWQGPSMPLTPCWERTTDTHFQHDFLPADHVHDWMFAQGSPYHFFGTTWGGCAIGGGRYVSELSGMYESSEQFRSFIAQRLRDGSLSRSNVIALMSVPRASEPSPLKKDADALLGKFFAR